MLDINTYELATATQAELLVRTGRKAFLVAALVSRRYVDFNRPASDAYESASVAPVYQAYHTAMRDALSGIRASANLRALLIDIHGQGDDGQIACRGTRNGQTAALTPLYSQPDALLARLLSLGIRIDPPSPAGSEHPAYDGGHIVATYGVVAGGVQAVQLEFGVTYRQAAGAWTDTASKLADALVRAVNCVTC